MSVYVDNAFIAADVPNGARTVSGRWCHMTADSRGELDAMADRIGLRRDWIQHPGTSREHYDVTEPKRRAAVAAGAVERDWREMAIERVEQRRAGSAEQPARASRRVSGRLVPPRSFVAIDFETANGSRASIIQAGVTRVIDGEIGTPHVRPVYPPDGHRHWGPGQFAIHRLPTAYIVGAEAWPETLERLVRLATMPDGTVLPLVAHNAAFEKSAINKISEVTGVMPPWGAEDYFCTVKYARQQLPDLPKHRLDYLVEHLSLGEFSHHDAGEDAAMTARLLLRLAQG